MYENVADRKQPHRAEIAKIRQAERGPPDKLGF